MTDAERRLIASALLDLSNERFVLLSEACIPLFNFTNTYNYFINTKLNFVQLFDDPGREGQGRYSSEMSPQISLSNWRKGSQWFASNRKLAVEIRKTQIEVLHGLIGPKVGKPIQEHLEKRMFQKKFWIR
ncbi:hypothetical protein F8388_019836 [Cannabis sativa]|uniref:Uncharacterized protein n=1 Tax=Cannabis sativa TaxID=3483 RepID=A0A7J6HPN3_CANSA|nr:hypothetical protein F8388_019836 [Cannabis sativa]